MNCRLAPGILAVNIRPRRQQACHCQLMPSGGGGVQRRLPLSVLHVQAYRVLDQFLDHRMVAAAHGEVEGSAACCVLGEHVGLET